MSKLTGITITANTTTTAETMLTASLLVAVAPNRDKQVMAEVVRRAAAIEAACTETSRGLPVGSTPTIAALESVLDDVRAGRFW